jgi:hypothetical protein
VSFIINPNSIDRNQIKTDIRAFIDGLPDAAKWQDFFDSSQGTTIIDIMAGMGGFFAYNTIVARRENYIRNVTNRSSAVGIAGYLGYSAFRGTNSKLKLNVTPNFTGTINKKDILGSVQDKDIIALADTPVTSGIAVDIDVVVGSLLSEDITVPNAKPNSFRYSKKNVSSDIFLSLNGTEVPLSSTLIDATKEKFVAISNVFGSVDVFYLNTPTFTTKYDTGDTLTLEWIELGDLTFALADVSFDFGTLNTSEVTSNFIVQEDTDSIKINAPLFHETQFVIRGREDYLKNFQLIDTTLLDTDFRDISPSVIDLVYIRSDLSLFSAAEKAVLIAELATFRSMGLQPPTISDPVRVPLSLQVTATLANADGDPVTEITDKVNLRENILQKLINFGLLENEIESAANILIARPVIISATWSAALKVRKGSYITPTVDNGRIYRVNEFIYLSAGVEPTFPVVEGDLITDGEIVWEARAQQNLLRLDWLATTQYREGDIVVPTTPNNFEYVAVDFINLSGATEPVWPPLSGQTPAQVQGTLVEDGGILWMMLPQVGTPAVWTTATNYKTGSLIIPTNQTTSDMIGVMLQCVGFLGTTAGSEPVFPTTLDDLVTDGNISWEANDPQADPKKLGFNEYFTIATTVVAS